MNNAKIVEEYNVFNEEVIPRLPFLEKRFGEVKEVLEAIKGLKRNEYYQKLKKFLLDTRLANLGKSLRSEQDPIKLYRLQGKLDELENFVDLDKLHELYQREFDYIKGQIKSENNAER